MQRAHNKVKSTFKALEAAVESGDATACVAAMGECCCAAAALAESQNAPKKKGKAVKAAAPPDPAELTALLDRIEEKCATAKAGTTTAADGGQAAPEVGALWDGQLFTKIIANLPGLIAILRDLFSSKKDAPPTE